MIVYVPITRWTKIRAIKKKYQSYYGKGLDLSSPRKYSEKIQWLKLNYKSDSITKGADKVEAREVVKSRVGEDILIPVVGVYERVEDIDWETLPKKFVAKINNGCGLNIVCTDRDKLDKDETLAQLDEWLKPIHNHYWRFYEWGYKNIKPRIIIEHFVGDEENRIHEYKFLYINDKLAYIMAPVERSTDNQFDYKIFFYDKNWQKLPLSKVGHEAPGYDITKPDNLDKMLEISENLAAGYPVCRVDLYESGGEVKFGELTFTPSNGLYKLSPAELDEEMLGRLELPVRNNFDIIEWKPIEIKLRDKLMSFSGN